MNATGDTIENEDKDERRDNNDGKDGQDKRKQKGLNKFPCHHWSSSEDPDPHYSEFIPKNAPHIRLLSNEDEVDEEEDDAQGKSKRKQKGLNKCACHRWSSSIDPEPHFSDQSLPPKMP